MRKTSPRNISGLAPSPPAPKGGCDTGLRGLQRGFPSGMNGINRSSRLTTADIVAAADVTYASGRFEDPSQALNGDNSNTAAGVHTFDNTSGTCSGRTEQLIKGAGRAVVISKHLDREDSSCHDVRPFDDNISTLTDPENESNNNRSGSGRRKRGSEVMEELDHISRTTPFLPSNQGRIRNSSKGSGSNSIPTSTNRLRFHELQLHGREKEVQILQECLSKTLPPPSSRPLASSTTSFGASEGDDKCNMDGMDGNNADDHGDCCHQLVLLSGESGVGKTALAVGAMETAKPLQGSKSGICLWGKFDQAKAMQEPYAAFVGAFQQLVGNLLLSKKEQEDAGADSQSLYQTLQNELMSALDSAERGIMVETFEDLDELFPPASSSDGRVHGRTWRRRQPSSQESHEAKKSRFHNAFRKFIRVIAKQYRPLCIVLDDLQWAGLSSLALLEIILIDPLCSSVMIIGVYRSKEVDETHSFSKVVRDLRQRLKDNSGSSMKGPVYEIHDIPIGNLDMDATRGLLSDILSTDDQDKLDELVPICHEKTRNNPFFLLTFVRSLCDNHYLEFNLSLYEWKFDPEEIRTGTGSTENVAEMVKQRMGYLDARSLLVLKLAGEGAFLRWVHDSIQEAAILLVSGEARRCLEKEIGSTLLEKLSETQLDSAVFVVTNLLNNGTPPATREDRLQLASLNLRAANAAAFRSAVENAATYARSGLDLLPEDKWETCAELTLGLYTTSCRAETCLGSHEYVMALTDEVLQRDNIKPLEKLPLVLSKASILESQDGRFEEAMSLCSSYLKELGCRIPRSGISLVCGTVKTLVAIKGTKKKLSEEFISKLPVAQDPKVVAAMLVLDKYCAIAIIASSPVFPLIAHRMLSFTLKHGLCDASPPAFALVAMLMLAVFGDLQGASLYATTSKDLMPMLPNPQICQARTVFLSSFFTFAWTQPLNSSVKPLLEGYEVGLANGDIDSALYCVGTYVTVAMLAGRPLEGLLDDCRVYFGQMKKLGRERMYIACNICWQAILNLMGFSEDHLTLTGEAMDQEEFLVNTLSPEMESNLCVFHWIRAFLYSIFGNTALGANHAIEIAEWLFKKFPWYPPNFCLPYYMGTSLIDTYKTQKKKKYLKHAKFLSLKLDNYAKKGNPNVQHYKMALEGEMLALKDKTGEATSKLEKAIALATRGGFIHDSALMNERFGNFLMPTDGQRALHHLTVAYSLYVEWGARKKAEMLLEKHKDLLPRPTDVVAGYTISPSTLGSSTHR
ncbi:Transcriptional regulator [Seminavis robusta]|uniref:Transcriptional regulator n=1 Tax=Seminavis robusta TaxID=568900 RepID=A0A9N8EMT5_9STRA|nr:Transcriptional regulator [Seminavis robusta]|eukprot:Sro1433_g272230.1 Transcriptional regulator (1251) ;mRNA; r:13065-17327